MFPQWQKDALAALVRDFAPAESPVSHWAAVYSAAITLADADIQAMCLSRAMERSISGDALYEVVLQSYLFLGFPRMLQAATVFHRIIDGGSPVRSLSEMDPDDLRNWIQRGNALCRRVYADKFEPLQRKVTAMAPEVFQWMIIEGYGKVLSRESLDIVSREMAIISCLVIENHQPQLRSHVIGALNVGASRNLIEAVIGDLKSTCPEGAEFALTVLSEAARAS